MEKTDFLNGSIAKSLIKFAIPLMLSLFLQALYGAVDLIIVGQFGSTASVSAVGTGSQLMAGLTTIILGISTGNTILIANKVGMRDNEGASRSIIATTKILSVITLVILVLVITFAEGLATILKAPSEAFDLTVSYIRICTIGLIFVAGYNLVASIYRGIGNSLSPLIFVAVACVVNIVGDLALVAGLKMEATGAAIATIVAQAMSMIFAFIYLKFSKVPFKIKKCDIIKSRSVVPVLKLGGPIATQDFLTSMSFLVITSFVNNLGLESSAAIGIVEKLFVFLSIVSMSFMSGLSAFVAQNIGANNKDRANKSLKVALMISFACGVVIFLFACFGGKYLCMIFEKNQAVIIKARDYLWGTSFEYLLIAIVFCLLGYFNGRGKTAFVMAQGLSTAFLVRVPLTYVFANMENPKMHVIGLAVSISAFVSLLLSISYYIFLRIKDKKNDKLEKSNQDMDNDSEINCTNEVNDIPTFNQIEE